MRVAAGVVLLTWMVTSGAYGQVVAGKKIPPPPAYWQHKKTKVIVRSRIRERIVQNGSHFIPDGDVNYARVFFTFKDVVVKQRVRIKVSEKLRIRHKVKAIVVGKMVKKTPITLFSCDVVGGRESYIVDFRDFTMQPDDQYFVEIVLAGKRRKDMFLLREVAVEFWDDATANYYRLDTPDSKLTPLIK